MALHRVAKIGQLIKVRDRSFRIAGPIRVELPGEDIEYQIGTESTPPGPRPERRVHVLTNPPMKLRIGATELYTFDRRETVLVELPGTDIEYTVQPPGQPTAVDVLIHKNEDLSNRLVEIAGGTSDRPRIVALESGGTWRETFGLRISNVHFVSSGGGPRPIINADTGVTIASGVSNVRFTGIDFIGNGDRGSGVHMISNRVNGLTFEDCLFRNFKGAVTAHNNPAESSFSQYHRNLAFLRCRLLDGMGTLPKEGHGIFAMGIDGFTVEECLIDKSGWNKGGRFDIFTHGVYDQHGNRRCVYRRNIISRAESVGIQTRGPLHDSHASDNGDPGQQLIDNIFVDCAIAMLVNGPRATITGNYVIPGHFHNSAAGKHGQGGLMAHIGDGRVENNIRLGGPAPTGGQTKMPAWDISRRRRTSDAPWWWDKDVSRVITRGNQDKPNVQLLPEAIAMINSGRKTEYGSTIELYNRIRALVRSKF